MTDERINEALEELKRVDHLIYVSLKYTRTVDVIINILGRMVDAYALIMDALIEHGKAKGNISSEPESAVEKAELVRSVYQNDDVVVDNTGLYLLLRKLLRARNVERENEYRRHVTMKTIIEGREEIVNIDIITNYYLFLRDFLAHTRGIIEGVGSVELRDQTFDQPHAPAWMDAKEDYDDDKEDEPIRVAVTRTPPVKAAVKIRSVTAPPRKRVPRPKKYKIQIPKGKDPIMRPPYEHDPKYNMSLRQEAKKPVLKKAALKAKKPVRPAKASKPAKQAKPVKRSPPKSKLRRTVNSLTRALRKAASKKKA